MLVNAEHTSTVLSEGALAEYSGSGHPQKEAKKNIGLEAAIDMGYKIGELLRDEVHYTTYRESFPNKDKITEAVRAQAATFSEMEELGLQPTLVLSPTALSLERWDHIFAGKPIVSETGANPYITPHEPRLSRGAGLIRHDFTYNAPVGSDMPGWGVSFMSATPQALFRGLSLDGVYKFPPNSDPYGFLTPRDVGYSSSMPKSTDVLLKEASEAFRAVDSGKDGYSSPSQLIHAGAPTVEEYMSLQWSRIVQGLPPVDTRDSQTFARGLVSQVVTASEFIPNLHSGPPLLQFNASRGRDQVEVSMGSMTQAHPVLGHRPTKRIASFSGRANGAHA